MGQKAANDQSKVRFRSGADRGMRRGEQIMGREPQCLPIMRAYLRTCKISGRMNCALPTLIARIITGGAHAFRHAKCWPSTILCTTSDPLNEDIITNVSVNLCKVCALGCN